MNAERLKIATTALSKITTVPRAEFDMTTVATIAQTALCDIDAIAPPVAAGNMDTLQRHAPNARYGEPSMEECAEGDYVLHAEAIAWGAQQRMEGKREGADTVAMAEQMKLFRSAHDEACIELKERAEKAEANEIRLQQLVIEAQDRAEKAEADLKQVNEWRQAALASNQQLHELMCAKLDAAEARVKELEAQLAAAKPYDLKA